MVPQLLVTKLVGALLCPTTVPWCPPAKPRVVPPMPHAMATMPHAMLTVPHEMPTVPHAMPIGFAIMPKDGKGVSLHEIMCVDPI